MGNILWVARNHFRMRNIRGSRRSCLEPQDVSTAVVDAALEVSLTCVYTFLLIEINMLSRLTKEFVYILFNPGLYSTLRTLASHSISLKFFSYLPPDRTLLIGQTVSSSAERRSVCLCAKKLNCSATSRTADGEALWPSDNLHRTSSRYILR